MKKIVERFIKYAKVDTTSNPNSNSIPSSSCQKDLQNIIYNELLDLGLSPIKDDLGYLYALIPSNTKKKVKKIGFIAHFDTSPDAPGKNVNPQIINNYDGKPFKLKNGILMDPNDLWVLNRVVGEDLIVTDGKTLLGADDKLGIAEIMELAEFLINNPDFEHGDIYLGFTPDEEIGRGADYFNLEIFKADYAYTLDGSEVGGIEHETFNAASAILTFTGVSIHPGSAKNKMINSQHLLMEFHQMLPNFLNPAFTEMYEGFNHLSNLSGSVEESKAIYIIRNHDKELFEKQKNDFKSIAKFLNDKYGYKAVKVDIKDSYYNMNDILKDHMEIIDLARTAIKNAGVTPYTLPVRGGTDGARLTFMGLPCPNLGTGGYNFHGRLEFASINQMEKAVEILKEIIKLTLI